MAYPANLLGADETVVAEIRPHWRALVLPIVLFVLTVGIGTWALSALPSGWSWAHWTVGIAMAILLVGFVGVPLAHWYTTQYVVTNHRIITRAGLLTKQGSNIPLSRITDVAFRRTLVERLVGCGTLTVESAGQHGQSVFRFIPHAEEVQHEIYQLVQAEREREIAGRTTPGPGTGQPTADTEGGPRPGG